MVLMFKELFQAENHVYLTALEDKPRHDVIVVFMHRLHNSDIAWKSILKQYGESPP